MSVTIHESQIMPSYAAEPSNEHHHLSYGHPHANFSLPTRASIERSPAGRSSTEKSVNGSTTSMNGKLPNGSPAVHPVPNGRPVKPVAMDKRVSQDDSREAPARDDGYFASVHSSESKDNSSGSTTHVKLGLMDSPEGAREASKDFAPPAGSVSGSTYPPAQQPSASDAPGLQVPGSVHRVSSPPAFNHNTASPSQHPYRLQQRHTLEVPRLSTTRARDVQNNTDDVVSASGRFSPTKEGRRRGSMSLVRRTTRSINSDMPFEEVPQDEDAARWAEHIRQKRASKRKRKEDDDEDRVVVGTKVDQNHVNWVTAYNMLTGIRFTVSRTNAKMDRELTDADFDAKHKFSFDMYVPPGFPYSVKNLVKTLLDFDFVELSSPA